MRALAFDFGASSGRAMIGYIEGGDIKIDEIHRFSNDPVEINGTVYWDILRLIHEVRTGITEAKNQGGFDSIGVDTWGVDFALIDKDGNLIDNPVHYRDSRTEGMPKEIDDLLGEGVLYTHTGLQVNNFNTIYQLYYLAKYRPDLLDRADKILFMPDFVMYYLTGNKRAEYTIASTSGLLNQYTNEWNVELMDILGIPSRLMPDIIMPGEKYGDLREDLARELQVPQVPVIAVCTHDTASAVVAVPFATENSMFISSGTWSLMGMELKSPDMSKASEIAGFSNERGYDGTVRYLRNIMGLWIINECRRQWIREGMDISYADIASLAEEAEPFRCFIDVDNQEFSPMGDMPSRIKEFCKRTTQRVPSSVGEVARCVYESLALKYRKSLNDMRETGRVVDGLNIVGGGINAKILCKFTSSACNLTVPTGPVEGTVIGNISVQLIAGGEIQSLSEARRMIAKSFDAKVYEPTDREAWDEAYLRYLEVVGK